ncbi:MAG: site-2 protease family protein, partial [Fusobacteriaceae bacterium]
LTVMLSINVGIFNLLPFPALDGGRIIFVLLELIGVKVDKKLEEKVHMAGMIILIGFIVYITGNDIFNMVKR